MFIDEKNLIELFIRDFRHNNPTINISDEDIENAIKLQYKALKNCIESDDIPHIRLKYFGSFRPLYGKLRHFERNINRNNVSQKEQERYERIFKKVKERYPEDKKKS